MRHLGWSTPLLALTLCLPGSPGLLAQRVVPPPPPDSDEILGTVYDSLADMEETLLKQEQERYRRFISLRRQVSAQLDQLYARADDWIARLGDPALLSADADEIRNALSDVESEVRRVEDQQAALVRDGAVIRERVREHATRSAWLRDRLRSIQEPATAGPERPTVSGAWRVKIYPTDTQATWTLRQTGTLISGTYETDSGRYGSFTGTLVERKLALQEIDSKLGRDASFYGSLSADGTTLRGTWESMDLSGGKPGFGSWTASHAPKAAAPRTEAAPEAAPPAETGGPR